MDYSSSPLGRADDSSGYGGLKKGACDEGSRQETSQAVPLVGKGFPEASTLIRSLLMLFEKESEFGHGKAQTKGDVFPLPTNTDQIREIGGLVGNCLEMLACLCMGLES